MQKLEQQHHGLSPQSITYKIKAHINPDSSSSSRIEPPPTHKTSENSSFKYNNFYRMTTN